MPQARPLTRSAATLFAGLALIACLGPWGAGDQGSAEIATQRNDAAKRSPQKRAAAAADFSGLETCSRCHDAGSSSTVSRPGGLQEQRSSDGWLKFDEYSIWASYREHQAKENGGKPRLIDKHGQAYQVLFTDRAKKMAELMRIPGRAAHLDQRCVVCHTGYPLESLEKGREKWMLAESIVEKPDLKFGVTCEGCHGGAAGKDSIKSWLGPHMVSPAGDSTGKGSGAWRYLASAMKHDEFGFTDVRTAIGKARLCLSCHLGNADAGRVVTHEMYAAGHPPLPGFEVQTFTEQMPAHWRTLAEKGKEKPESRSSFLKLSQDKCCNATTDPEGSLSGLKSLLVCATVALSEHVRLTSSLAGDSNEAHDRQWPELAQYDCFACHHDLQNMGWRSKRQPQGRVGRPVLREWPIPLARVAVEVAGLDVKALDDKLNELQAAIVATPFGDQKQVALKAAALGDFLDKQSEQIQRKPLKSNEADRALDLICKAAVASGVDYDSARQLAWAARAIVDELREIEKRPANPEVDQAFANLDRILQLSLRGGQSIAEFGEIPKFRGLPADLAVTLPPISKYGPDAVSAEFKKIGELTRSAKTK